jgi:hypothetical protein
MWRIIDRAGLLILPLLLAWLAVPSSWFLNVVGIEYDGRTVIFNRETPFGDVKADWTSEIRVAGSQLECNASGRALYQDESDNLVVFHMGDWALPCLENGPPYTIVQTWTVQLGGIIPLRSTTRTTIVR